MKFKTFFFMLIILTQFPLTQSHEKGSRFLFKGRTAMDIRLKDTFYILKKHEIWRIIYDLSTTEEIIA